MDIGSLRHQVRLETPTTTADGEGGYTTTWALLGVVYAAIEPATQRSLERLVANAVSSDASHVVTVRYIDGVTTKTRVLFLGRVLSVVGIQNIEERNEILRLACTEQVS